LDLRVIVTVTVGWRKLHHEELHNLYSSLNIIRMMRWTGKVAWGRSKMHTKFWMGSLNRRDHLQDLRMHRWEDKIKMDLRQIGWEGTVWIHLAQDRNWWWALVNMVMNLCIILNE
jgi:hypothetical protein